MRTYFQRYLDHEGIVLAALIVWLSLQYVVLGKFSFVPIDGDEAESSLPVMLALKHAAASRPLWFPFAAGGTDYLALGYVTELDRILFALLPGWLAYQVNKVALISAAVVGLYYLARRGFELDRAAAYFAAAAFGFIVSIGSFGYSVNGYTPLCLLALGRLLDNRKIVAHWIWATAVALLYAAVVPLKFLLIFPIVFFVAWFIVIERRKSTIDYLIVAGFFVIIYTVRLQDIIAYWNAAGLSHRVGLATGLEPVTAALMGLEWVYEYLNPFSILHWGIGLQLNGWSLTWWLFVIAVLFAFNKIRCVRRVAVFLLLCAILTVVLPVIAGVLFETLPALQGFYLHPKFWRITSVILAISGGVGVQYLLNQASVAGERSAWRWLSTAPMVVLLVAGSLNIGAYSAWVWVTEGGYKLIFESPVLQKLAARIEAESNPARVVSFGMRPNFVNAYGLESGGGRQDLILSRYRQYWDAVTARAGTQAPMRGSFFDKIGHIMALGSGPSDLRQSNERRFNSTYNLNLLSAANVRYILSRDHLTDISLRQVNEDVPLQTWSELSPRQKIDINLKANFTGRTHLFVYENTLAFPRFYLANRTAIRSDSGKIIKEMASASLAELRRTAYFEESNHPAGIVDGGVLVEGGTVRIGHYSTDRIELSIELTGKAVMIVGNTYSPDWSANIDGHPTQIYPANGAFWGLALPAGARQVRFRYTPSHRSCSLTDLRSCGGGTEQHS